MMLDLKNQNGATIIVPISFNYKDGRYEVNYVHSIYSKTYIENGKPNNRWFLNQISSGNLVYKNTKKSRQWAASSGHDLPRVGPRTGGKNKIFTEKDLVNLKEQNPSLYQDENGKRGDETLGTISRDQADEMGLPGPGIFIFDEIKFPHIDEKHGEQFKKVGFENAGELARYVLENVEAVYQAGHGALRFVRRLENGNERYGNLVAEFEAREESGVYKITTAFPVKKRFLKNKKLLWECSPHIHSENLQANVSDDTWSQSNGKNLSFPDEAVNPADSNQNLHQNKSTKRGSTTIYPQTYLINLFKGADMSTLLHEIGHVFFEEMGALVASGAADANLVNDYRMLLDWLGAKPGEALTIEQREKAARRL